MKRGVVVEEWRYAVGPKLWVRVVWETGKMDDSVSLVACHKRWEALMARRDKENGKKNSRARKMEFVYRADRLIPDRHASIGDWMVETVRDIKVFPNWLAGEHHLPKTVAGWEGADSRAVQWLEFYGRSIQALADDRKIRGTWEERNNYTNPLIGKEQFYEQVNTSNYPAGE